jgi:hypothetical protein
MGCMFPGAGGGVGGGVIPGVARNLGTVLYIRTGEICGIDDSVAHKCNPRCDGRCYTQGIPRCGGQCLTQGYPRCGGQCYTCYTQGYPTVWRTVLYPRVSHTVADSVTHKGIPRHGGQ